MPQINSNFRKYWHHLTSSQKISLTIIILLLAISPLLIFAVYQQIELRSRATNPVTPITPITPVTPPNPDKNPINWITNRVSLSADNFYLEANGKKYYANTGNLSLHSDPGSNTYTTLEAQWTENDVEMRLYIYFNANTQKWWSPEMRTYNGEVQGDWIYYYGKFFENTLGSRYTSSSIFFTSSAPQSSPGTIHFENLKIQAFTNLSLPSPSPTPTPSLTPTPTYTPTPTNTPTPTSTPSPKTITLQIKASSNDVNQDGTVLGSTSTKVWLGTGANITSSYTGFRFQKVNIPKGAQILSAKLEVYSPNSPWISMSFALAGHNTGNSPTFSTTNKPSQRPLTMAKFNHSSNVKWNTNTWYSFGNFKTVLQEIINRSDWQSGNSISLILKGTGTKYGRKYVTSFDGNPSLSPKLVITYK